MAHDPADTQLVAAVLERGKRRGIDDDLVTPKSEEDEQLADARPGHRRRARRRRLGRRARRPDAVGGAAGQALAAEADEPTPGGAGRDRRRHDRHRRPRPHVPQGDRQGAAPDGRGRGRPGQGHRARRADRRPPRVVRAGDLHGEPWKAVLSLWEWTRNETEKKTRTKHPQHRLPYGSESERIVYAAVGAHEGRQAAAGDARLPPHPRTEGRPRPDQGAPPPGQAPGGRVPAPAGHRRRS